MKNKLFILIYFLFQTINFFPQENIIATVGKDKIDIQNFKKRFQFSCWIQDSKKSDEIQRRNFLYSLIAEKLFAFEAERIGLDTSEIMKTTFKAIEKMFLRDALWKQEIENKITVTDSELIDGIKKYRTSLKINFLFSSDSVEALRLYSELKSKKNFDSLLQFRDEKKFQPSFIEIEFGKMNSRVENIIYSLQKNEFTFPIKDDAGWFIYFIKEKESKYFSKEENKKVKSKVKNIILQSRREKNFQGYFKKFFTDKKIEADGNLFWSFVDKLVSVLEKKAIKEKLIYLQPNDIDEISAQIGKDSLALPFIKYENESVTLKEFLYNFLFDGFYTDTVEAKIISAKINSRVKTFIEQELLARESISKGNYFLTEVKEDILNWKNFYLAKLYKNYLFNSINVSEEEMISFFNKKKDSLNQIYININEILSDSLEVIELAMNEIQRGKDFGELASIYTKRKWTKEKQGEWGLMPASSMGEIGQIASRMNIGDIYGPLKLEEGFSLFKLIDKKENKIFSEDFDKNRNIFANEIRLKKFEKVLIEKTAALANEFEVRVNENLLFNSEIKNLNMLVFRYIGFGGRITAFPQTIPFIEWMNYWQQKERVKP